LSETRAYRQLSSTAIAIILLTTLLPLTITTTPAFAQAPTITISPTSGTVSTLITIEGRGFPPEGTVTLRFDDTVLTPVRASFRVGGALTTDAEGAFRATAFIPAAATFGAHTISATVGTASATATFTVNPRIRLCTSTACTAFRTAGFPDQDIGTTVIDLSGFGASETVTVTLSAAFTITSVEITTDSTGSAQYILSPNPIVKRTTGGAKTITATSPTTSASTTFTVRTAVAFYATQTSDTIFSILGTTPTVIFVEGYGFPSGTIPANSITIGGVSTTHPAVTVGASGLFGVGAGAHLAVSPNTSVPLGLAEVSIAGTTFSFAARNIVCALSPGGTCPIPGAGGVPVGWGGPLISSVPGTSASTAVVRLNKETFFPGDTTERMVLFGHGFAASASITIPDPPGFTFTPASTTADLRGAFWLRSDPGMSELAAGEFTVAVTGGGVLNVIQPTYRTQAWVELPATPPIPLDYKTSIGSIGAIKVHGFTASSTVTVKIGPATLGTIPVGANGAGSASFGTPVDLAGGTYDVVATDNAPTPVSATESGAISIRPRVDFTSPNNALTVNTGSAGTFTVLRSGSDFGVHGLKASTAYRIHWGLDPAAPAIASFTTDTRGQIPPPGVQFSVPGGTAGVHILVIREAATGADALFGLTLANIASSLGGGRDGRYGDLLFLLEVTLTATPSVGGVGTTIALSGSGLRASTPYVITITTISGGAGATGQIFATFTSTADGSVPAGFTFTFPELPTTAPNEKGTTYFIHVSRAVQYPGAQDGQARFVLQATATLDKTVANPGDSVIISAKGLAAGTVYSVQFGFKSLSDPGITVASLVPNAVGTGSATFTIPSGTAAGTHTVQLVATGPDRTALAMPPTIQVGVVEAAGQVDTATFQETAKSDKTSYRPGETVTISAQLKVLAGTGKVNFVVTIKDAAGNVILVNKMANVPLTTDPVTLTVQTTITKPGTYTANIQVLTPADVPIAFKNVTFTVG